MASNPGCLLKSFLLYSGKKNLMKTQGFDEKFMIIFRMFAVYPPIAASEARLLAANSRGNKKSRAAVETYDCKHCNRSFNKQYNLLIHERSHEKSENQTLFNCNICGKGFRSMNNMKNHRYCFYLSYSLQGFTKSEFQIPNSHFFLKNKDKTLLSRFQIKGNGIDICSNVTADAPKIPAILYCCLL